jgi:putative FmdB family regulatory protein
MPRYDYRCRSCDARFEVRRGLEEPETAVPCPAGHPETSRVFTAVAVGGTAGGTAAGAPAPSGGCCGGGCCG